MQARRWSSHYLCEPVGQFRLLRISAPLPEHRSLWLCLWVRRLRRELWLRVQLRLPRQLLLCARLRIARLRRLCRTQLLWSLRTRLWLRTKLRLQWSLWMRPPLPVCQLLTHQELARLPRMQAGTLLEFLVQRSTVRL